jgi:hypothetical protein
LRVRAIEGIMVPMPGIPRGRKLLIASLGVAAVSYVACSGDDDGPGVVANLMAIPTDSGAGGSGGSSGTGGSDSDAGTGGSGEVDGGDGDAAAADAADTGPVFDWDVVANLVPPPPSDD